MEHLFFSVKNPINERKTQFSYCGTDKISMNFHELLSAPRMVKITAILAATHAATVPATDQPCHTATHGKIGSVKI